MCKLAVPNLRSGCFPRLCSSTQTLPQVFCPWKLAFWKDLTASGKVIAAIKQESPYYDLIKHRILMMIDMTCAGRTEEATNVFAYISY
jgi:hypothetical protein